MATNICRKYVIFGILGIWRLDKKQMVRFAQISCKLHEHVGCSSFESSAYFI